MTRNPVRPSGDPSTSARPWRARLIVLGPLAAAIPATILGAEAHILAPLWLAAVAWTVLASLAGALARGFRHGDWSAFRGRPYPEGLPGDRGELDEWAARTGPYAWLGDDEDRLRDHERLS